ncbi:MAG: DUF177 domain-containing protein [Myxococcales bacterium]|nr:DUF177 domain-containing protein [Myxococcales bacterium]
MLVQTDLPRTLFADALEGTDADVDGATGNIRIELSKDRDLNVFARGDVKALVHVPCALCLQPSLVKISAPLKMTFVAGDDEVEGSDDPLDDLEVSTHDGVEVDLGAIIREQIILALPMSPRCRENCAGLCATCGQNKNERDCGHKPPVLEDPRLAVLKNLKVEK